MKIVGCNHDLDRIICEDCIERNAQEQTRAALRSAGFTFADEWVSITDPHPGHIINATLAPKEA